MRDIVRQFRIIFMIKHCLNLYASLIHGYPSCLPQQTPAIVAARLAGRWRVMSGKRELCP
jgi:hypothetical protein